MKDSRLILWIFLLVVSLNSCNLDELEFKKLSGDANWNPEMVLPLAKGNLNAWELLNGAVENNESSLVKDPDGLLKIVYRKNDLLNYSVHDLFSFPTSQSFTLDEKPLGEIYPEDMVLSTQISLDDLSGLLGGSLSQLAAFNGSTSPFPAVSAPALDAPFNIIGVSDFEFITLSKGVLDIHIENRLKVPVTVKGSLFDKTFNKSIKEFTFSNLLPGEFKNVTSDLTGVEISNQVEFKLLTFETPGSITPVNINMQDYFKIKFMLKDLGISKGSVKVTKQQTLKEGDGAFDFTFSETEMKAFGAHLKKGLLTIRNTSNLPLSGFINFTLNEIKYKATGMPVSANIPLNGNPLVISLDDTEINFTTDPAKPYSRVPYTYSITLDPSPGYIQYSSADIFKLDVALDNLDFESFTGDFGKRVIEVDPGMFSMDVKLLDKLSGGLKLANPTLSLTIRNSIGVPASMAVDFLATGKEGSSVALNAPAFDIPVPADLNAGNAVKTVVFNNQNSSIVDFIALPPTGSISYKGKVNFNTTQAVTAQNPNFLDSDGIFGIDLALELPLQLQITNLTFMDTAGISGEDFKKVETAELVLHAKNSLPLDVEMQLLYVDTLSGQQYGASKLSKVLSAAKVSATGEITPTQSTHTFILESGELEKLRKANGVVFAGKISSPDSGATLAPIYSDSNIEISVVLKSKINL